MRRPVPFRRSRLTPILIALVLCYLLYANLPPSRPRIHYVPSTFDWASLPQRNPVSSQATLPRGQPLKRPKIQHDFAAVDDASKPTKERLAILRNRRNAVLRAFRKSWAAYKTHAWMHDELAPVSGRPKDPFGGWAATLVDSLDTLWIMDLKAEFYEAVAAVATIDWDVTKETACNFFETTIRHLGGLLSAYDLSGEPTLLRKAVELGDMLYAAFDTPTRMPPFWLDFRKAKAGTLAAGTHDPSASVASSSLEFTRLAQLTGDDKYYDAIDRVTRLLERTQNITQLPGMWPTFFDMTADPEHIVLEQRSSFSLERSFTLGALADSLYEYLPKMHALIGGQDPVYERLYRGAADTVRKNLLFRPMLPDREDILFSGSVWIDSVMGTPKLDPEGQHLTCFVGGMFGLGGKLFGIKEHLDLGERLARGCSWAYAAFPTGIMPEIFNMVACPGLEACAWDEDKVNKKKGGPLATGTKTKSNNNNNNNNNVDAVKRNQKRNAGMGKGGSTTPPLTNNNNNNKQPHNENRQQQPLKKKKKLNKEKPDLPAGFTSARDPRYLLRPEAIESIFLMYRMTGKTYYQDVAWTMFEAITRATETDLAFSAIKDVSVVDYYDDDDDDDDDDGEDDGDENDHDGGVVVGNDLKNKRSSSNQQDTRISQGSSSSSSRGGNGAGASSSSSSTISRNRQEFSRPTNLEDSMESFWLAETLKYFYLVFSDPSLISLDEYVLNTEAHPLRLPPQQSD